MSSESIRTMAHLDLNLLDELALDPRAYDHLHPSNQRPGYQFGEWDPHCIDNQGHYRRFVLRLMILDALLAWVHNAGEERREDAEFEAAATLAGTMLLASAVSGWGPGAHRSDVSLATIMPLVARTRDAFYTDLLGRLSDPRGKRLRDEAERLRQPFGGVRTFLNHDVARSRAQQLVRDRLAILYARMGFVRASRAQSALIEIPSTRMRTEIDCLIMEAGHRLHSGKLEKVLDLLSQAEDVLHRAIECGAIVDPWNILGFQGNYLRFISIEDSIVDIRVDTLLRIMLDLFEMYSECLRECAATGDEAIAREIERRFDSLADWWDQFATFEVSDQRRVCGREQLDAARFVAQALSDWRQSGEEAGNVSFWRQRADAFDSAQSFGLVVEALLARKDYISSMALMMQWLSQHESVSLDEGADSFFDLIVRWMTGLVEAATAGQPVASKSTAAAAEPAAIIVKFFDFLEANAGSLWWVPRLFAEQAATDDARLHETFEESSEDDIFAAAYEGVTFRGESEDGVDSSLAGSGPLDEDLLVARHEELTRRLRFLGTVARLWQLAAWGPWRDGKFYLNNAPIASWIDSLRTNRRNLLKLLDKIEAYKPTPASTSRDSLAEFERRSSVRESLLQRTIAVTIETSHALRTLMAIEMAPPSQSASSSPQLHNWETHVIPFEGAILRGDWQAAKDRLDDVLEGLATAPLMYVPTDKGGRASDICAAQYARDVLRRIAIQLPSTGDFEGTYRLLETVLEIELDQSSKSSQVQQVSEFNLLFRVAFRSLMTRLIERLNAWRETRSDDRRSTLLVGKLVSRFSQLWATHVASVRIWELERRTSQREWRATKQFIQTYGTDLFTQAFMAMGNLRGVLHHGARSYLEHLLADAQPPFGQTLLRAIQDGSISIEVAADHLDFITRCVLERHAIYRDYNTTTPQSDYGENLHLLLEILRVLADYERRRWALEPGYIAHSELVRNGRFEAATLLREAFERETNSMAQALKDRLAKTEESCGLRLPTVSAEIAEGFVGQLRVDKTLALAEQALIWKPMKAKRAFQLLCDEVELAAASSLGSGIDLPEWLVRLEDAVDRTLDIRDGKPIDFEEMVMARKTAVELRFEDFRDEIDDWEED